MAKKKILIIEDEHILGELLVEKLQEAGHEVSLVPDGEVGMRAMRAQTPDMVLLDIVMPNKDGYEVLTEMRADSVLQQVPVIVISNSGQPVEVQRIFDLGAKDYIVKAEFSPAEVLEKVEKYLGVTHDVVVQGKKDLSGVQILIVEDDPFLSSITATRLEREGYTVSVVTDGEQALATLEKEIPHLVLLDIVMPGISGFEVLKKIRADARFKDVAVVMFSNLGQEHEIEESKALGADDFLIKAKFAPREVLEKIQTLLTKKGVL